MFFDADFDFLGDVLLGIGLALGYLGQAISSLFANLLWNRR